MTWGAPARTVGRFEVLGVVGRGGMGEVWAVRCDGQTFALKVALAADPAAVRRFEREARLQGRIDHPNVLPVLEVCSAAGRPAVLLPFVAGPGLDRLMAATRLPTIHALALWRQVVAGVAAVHASGFVHRDLKPSNVLIAPTDGGLVARVADFGIAKALRDDDRLTHTGFLLGTPAYAAPELHRDAPRADARADVWGLGCLLVELLVGSGIGRGRTWGDLAARVSDPPWADLARRLLAVDPADRPADATAVAALLPPGSAVVDDRELLDLCRRLAPIIDPAGLGAEPTLLPAAEPRVPAERDPFVGREADLSAIDQRFDEGARAITLVGPGGVGKTRLALRYAWTRYETRWPGGVWFCDLTHARDQAGIVGAMGRAFELPAASVEAVDEAIAARGGCLVVLDNFEQVARLAEPTLGRWLGAARHARFLVTSREVLNVGGEAVLQIEPMVAAEAEALFVQRARAADHRFEDCPEIGPLVQLLDGLPLAIELAAARIRLMTARTLLDRMADRFRWLARQGEPGDRHATLRATLDWSWELLGEAERDVLAQLAVFEGGFGLDAVAAVADVEGEVADVVHRLIDRSMVRRVVVRGQDPRMELLVTVRAYAAEQLELQGRLADAELRHGRYYAGLCTADALEGQDGEAVWRARDAELSNLVAACRRAVARGDGPIAASTAHAAWTVYERRGPHAAGVALLEAATAIPGLSEPWPAHLASDLGAAATLMGRLDVAGETLERALVLATPDEARLAAAVRCRLATVLREEGRIAEVREQLVSAIAAFRELGDRHGEGVAQSGLGTLAYHRGTLDEALACYEASLALLGSTGSPRQLGFVLTNLGSVFLGRGLPEESFRQFQAAREAFAAGGDRPGEARALGNLGALQLDAGRTREARAWLLGALAVQRELGSPRSAAIVCLNLGRLDHLEGRVDGARAHLDEALASARVVGDRKLEGHVLLWLGTVDDEGGDLSAAAARYADALALNLSVGDRRCAVTTSVRIALLAVRQGRSEEPSARLEEAVVLAREAGFPRGEAIVHAALAELHLRAHRDPVAARRASDLALAGLRSVDPWECAEMWCVRAEVEHADGTGEAARSALREARAVAARIGAGRETPLGRQVARVGSIIG